ncbi:MAG: DUF1761 family protein [Saprospiraceae bacterium]
MFNQKVLIGTFILAIINFAAGFLWYDVLMADYYPTMEGANRIPINFPILIVGVLIFSYAFTRLFQLIQNNNEPLMGQAIRYGLLVGLLTAVSYALFNHALMQIWSGTHHIVDAIFNTIMAIIMACVLAKYFGPEGARPGGVTGGGDI